VDVPAPTPPIAPAFPVRVEVPDIAPKETAIRAEIAFDRPAVAMVSVAAAPKRPEPPRSTLVDAFADADDDEPGDIQEVSQEETDNLLSAIEAEVSPERIKTPKTSAAAPIERAIEDSIPGIVVRRHNQPRPRVDLARHEARVKRVAQRILSAYHDEPPAAVAELTRLVERGRMEALATGLDKLWCDTLRAHIERDAGVPRAVIQGYQALHAMRTQSV
jgi:hypothetical protein